MTINASTKREADRVAAAMLTMTGYQPTVFRCDDGGYRVQENAYGKRWETALSSLLSSGVRSCDCKQSRVMAEMERLGL